MKITNTFQLLVRSIATGIIGEYAKYSDKRSYGRRFKWYSNNNRISFSEYLKHKSKIDKMLKSLGIVNVRVEVNKNGNEHSPGYLRHPFLVIHVKNA